MHTGYDKTQNFLPESCGIHCVINKVYPELWSASFTPPRIILSEGLRCHESIHFWGTPRESSLIWGNDLNRKGAFSQASDNLQWIQNRFRRKNNQNGHPLGIAVVISVMSVRTFQTLKQQGINSLVLSWMAIAVSTFARWMIYPVPETHDSSSKLSPLSNSSMLRNSILCLGSHTLV